jgi:hypothetical protein
MHRCRTIPAVRRSSCDRAAPSPAPPYVGAATHRRCAITTTMLWRAASLATFFPFLVSQWVLTLFLVLNNFTVTVACHRTTFLTGTLLNTSESCSPPLSRHPGALPPMQTCQAGSPHVNEAYGKDRMVVGAPPAHRAMPHAHRSGHRASGSSQQHMACVEPGREARCWPGRGRCMAVKTAQVS